MKINRIRTFIITGVRNKFGVAQQAALLCQGFPPKSFLCPCSNWPDTSQSCSLYPWQKLGNIFCHLLQSFLSPRSSDSFQKSKATVHRVPSCGPRTTHPRVLISRVLRSVQIQDQVQQQCCSSLYQDYGDVDVEPGLCATWQRSSATPGWSKPCSAKLPSCLFHPTRQRNMHPVYSSCYM